VETPTGEGAVTGDQCHDGGSALPEPGKKPADSPFCA